MWLSIPGLGPPACLDTLCVLSGIAYALARQSASIVSFGHVRMAWCNQCVLLLPQWQQLSQIQTAMRTGVTRVAKQAPSRHRLSAPTNVGLNLFVAGMSCRHLVDGVALLAAAAHAHVDKFQPSMTLISSPHGAAAGHLVDGVTLPAAAAAAAADGAAGQRWPGAGKWRGESLYLRNASGGCRVRVGRVGLQYFVRTVAAVGNGLPL